jgi:hypothetical protein
MAKLMRQAQWKVKRVKELDQSAPSHIDHKLQNCQLCMQSNQHDFDRLFAIHFEHLFTSASKDGLMFMQYAVADTQQT